MKHPERKWYPVSENPEITPGNSFPSIPVRCPRCGLAKRLDIRRANEIMVCNGEQQWTEAGAEQVRHLT